MKISKSSWHYRLWRYIVFGQTTGAAEHWFVSGVPTSLCPYVNRLFMYFFVQLPALIAIGVGVTVPVVLGVVQFIASGNLVPKFHEALVFVVFMIYIALLFAAALFFAIEWANDVRRKADIHIPAVPMPRAAKDTASLAREYFHAVHKKICPRIEVVDDE